jgi:ATP-dependent Clp protease ATP-binding subunit ClpA
MLNDVISDLTRKNIRISFTDEARTFLLDRGFDPKFGARPLRKTVQRHVEDEMAEWVLTGRIVPGDLVEVTAADGALRFAVLKPVILPTAGAVIDVPSSPDA